MSSHAELFTLRHVGMTHTQTQTHIARHLSAQIGPMSQHAMLRQKWVRDIGCSVARWGM